MLCDISFNMTFLFSYIDMCMDMQMAMDMYVCVQNCYVFSPTHVSAWGHRSVSKLSRDILYDMTICISTCICIGIRIHMCICTCICTHARMRAYTRACVRTQAGMCPRMREYVWYVYVHTQMYIYMLVCSKLCCVLSPTHFSAWGRRRV